MVTGELGSGVVEPAYNGNPLVGAALSEKSITLSLYGISQVLVWQVIHAKASSARIVSRPASGGAYRAGETVAVELGFGEDILVRGTPQLELVLDSGKVVARYASGSGTDRLRFEYVVRIGDHTARIEASLDEDERDRPAARRRDHHRRQGRGGRSGHAERSRTTRRTRKSTGAARS